VEQKREILPRRQRIARAEKKKNLIAEAMRHPLILLMLGSILTSIIIPWLNARSARVEQVQLARADKAKEILKSVSADNARVNLMRAAFDTFEKEGGLVASIQLEERRTELRKRVYDGYNEFESTAWWWYWEIAREAEIFGWLSSGDLERLKKFCVEYQQNLEAVSKSIQRPWRRYLSEIKENASDKKLTVMPEVSSELGALQSKREAICKAMVQLFL
jgi:hypothetical protein